MATSPGAVVPAGSVDSAGVSIATAIPSISNPRAGAAYNPVQLAGAAPVWFHPRYDNTYLWINATRWYGASPVGGNPGAYTAYSIDPTPSWYVLDGPSGQRTQVPNYPVHIPMNTLATNVTVTAAASRAPQYLYLLNSATVNNTPTGVLQHFNLAANGAVTILGEEVLLTAAGTVGTVVFNKGLHYDTPYLLVYGTDTAGNVYRMRKVWGKIGSNKTLLAPTQNYNNIHGNQVGWEYYTGTGYDTNIAHIAPVPGLTTVGPMSFARWRNQLACTTVVASGALRSAQVFISKSGMPWMPRNAPVPLGSTTGGTYLGVGMALQPQLTANVSALVPPEVAGIPYVISTRTGSSADYSLSNAWGMLTFTA